MPDTLLHGLFDTDMTRIISLQNFLLCIGCALVIGLLLALSCMYRSRCSKSFITTLALLPAAVCVVIMMVNGNIGAGVAVAGAFGLVRFRSVPGTGKEITMLFLAMGAGLIAGMGYLAFALIFTIVMCLFSILYSRLDFGARKKAARYKTLNITIPEDLDYSGVFDDIFSRYTASCELMRVKTTNMGSMFRLTYDIVMQPGLPEKNMLDELRCLNGNLEISLCCQETENAGL